MRKAIWVFNLLSLAGWFLSPNHARATTVIQPTFDELVARAEVILQGTTTKVESAWLGEGAERRIVTYVTFSVEDLIKGDATGTYTIRMLGGTIDGRTMKVTDAPEFKVGDRDIVFIEKNGQQFIPLVGIMHGRYRVQHDSKTGREIMAKNEGTRVSGLDNAGYLSATTPAATGLTSDEFKAAIRAKLNAK